MPPCPQIEGPDDRLALLRRTADLARLELTDEEAARLAPQFDAILGHFQVLASVDVEGIPPTLGATELVDVKRADEPRPSGPTEALLEEAPDRRDGHYGVPKTIGEAG